MSRSTTIERAHYAKLVGRQITAILLDGWDRDGNAGTVTVLADPEGNGPGHLDHNL